MAMTHHFVSAAILLRPPNNGSLCALKPLRLGHRRIKKRNVPSTRKRQRIRQARSESS
jgi:hypothetical protein